MNTRFFPYYTPTVIVPTVVDTVMVEFLSSSDMVASAGFVNDSIVNFDSVSGFLTHPKKSVSAKIAIPTQSNMLGVAQVNRAAPTLTEDCAFVFPFNRWNWPGSVVSVNQGSTIGTYLPSNTQLQQRTKVLRMSSKIVVGQPATHVTTQVIADLSAAYRINSFAIVSHNMTKSSTFRLRLSSDAAMTNVRYDSGVQPMWEPSFTDSGPYEEEVDSDGTPSADLIELLRYCGENPRTVRWITFDEVAARYAWVDFDDPNSSDAFTEISYIYLGLVVKVHPDQVYGWSLSPVSYSRVRRSASGSLWTDVFYRQIVATATFASQPDAFTLGFWSFISQILGKKKEFIIAFQPGDSLGKKFWFSLYGRFRQPPQLENLSSNASSIAMEIEELPG